MRTGLLCGPDPLSLRHGGSLGLLGTEAVALELTVHDRATGQPLGPAVGAGRLEGGGHQLAYDLGEREADEEHEPSSDDVREGGQEAGQQPVDGLEDSRERKEVEHGHQADEPHQHRPDGGERVSQGAAAVGVPVEHRDLREQCPQPLLDQPCEDRGDDENDDDGQDLQQQVGPVVAGEHPWWSPPR